MSERFVWIGPVRHIGGYGEVARGTLEGLQRVGASVVAVDSDGPVGELGAEALRPVEALLAGPVRERGATCVYHAAPAVLPRLLESFPMPEAERRVACTIAETDRIPREAVEALAPFDEVWVPAAFHRETFARSGVPRDRLRVVRYGIDTDTWTPGQRSPRCDGVFQFLYCFQLGWRKGFDLLLEAYLSEFSKDEPVELVLKLLGAPRGRPGRGDLAASVADRIDFFSDALPRVRVLEDELARDEMLELYRATDLYISTDRANGWGMPCHEAMACGTACATIDWSGSTEFMHEGNARLIPPGGLVGIDPRLIEAAPSQADDRWPDVALSDVRRVLREAFEGRSDLPELGRRAAADIREGFSLEAAGRAIVERNAQRYRPRPGLMDKVLTGLGLRGPSALVEGLRDRAFLCALQLGTDDWRTPLARYLDAYGGQDDVSLCLWADGDDESVLEDWVPELQGEIAAADDPPDLAVVVAPHDHVPWERFELDERFAAAPSSNGGAVEKAEPLASSEPMTSAAAIAPA